MHSDSNMTTMTTTLGCTPETPAQHTTPVHQLIQIYGAVYSKWSFKSPITPGLSLATNIWHKTVSYMLQVGNVCSPHPRQSHSHIISFWNLIGGTLPEPLEVHDLNTLMLPGSFNPPGCGRGNWWPRNEARRGGNRHGPTMPLPTSPSGSATEWVGKLHMTAIGHIPEPIKH